MSTKQIVLHTGLPKTGSTFLQKNYFNKFPKWNFYAGGSKFPNELGFVYRLNSDYDKLRKNGDFLRSNEKSMACSNMLSWAEKVAHLIERDGKNIVFSSEGLCGVSYSPLRNNLEVSIFLKHLFGSAKVIFFFRRQADYCESLYKQLVFKENRFGRYLEFGEMYAMEPTLKSLATIHELNWMRIVENYHVVFGKENVLAIPYEMMLHDLPMLLKRIENFVNVSTILSEEFFEKKENVSLSKYEYKHHSVFGSPVAHIFEGLNETQKNEINRSHKTSNSELSSLIDIDLSKYGYYD